MTCYICKKCYRISNVKTVSCPKCGATQSFVLIDEFAASRSPLGPAAPVGADTGGTMPEGVEGLLPPLPLFGKETEKESEKKRYKKKLVR